MISDAARLERSVWIDGVEVAPERATVSVFDRGFLYGDTVFETFRTYQGHPLCLDQHLERLATAADAVGIVISEPLASIAREVRAAVACTGIGDRYVRVTLSRGVGSLGLDPRGATRPRRIVMVEPLIASDPSHYERGVDVVTVRSERSASRLASLKTGNYLEGVLAMRDARAAGAVEAIYVDARGRVLEGSWSNVFCVTGRRIVTPPLRDGILPGLTRAAVVRIARETGLDVAEQGVSLEALLGAEEAFVSSSLRELVPVVRVDGRSIGAGAPGPVTVSLLRAYRAWTVASSESEARPTGSA
jgi:branched-chain amino acid aminotransferase